jgi:hypothetical protein
MSKLKRYLTVSGDEEVSTFRSLNLDLVEEETGNSDTVQKVSEEYALDDAAQQLLDRANAELKKMYRGKLKFDFCLENEGLTPDDVKIEKKKARQLKEKWFRLNDELSEIQIDFEEKLKKSLQK